MEAWADNTVLIFIIWRVSNLKNDDSMVVWFAKIAFK
ncbi:hypothetical protein KSMBR1_0562 [Candidatus Kuenenia stuttgartiensis]|uniref:Uncharacterized protein n=1 Tax=Kuenenia stuttgartiensis TaxID=174633 RepID=A0A2C9CBJ0_KUEST|nr:hypothetical protein KSMBR1_0562 [Candidatus Kuenenia stuttgartiensis]